MALLPGCCARAAAPVTLWSQLRCRSTNQTELRNVSRPTSFVEGLVTWPPQSRSSPHPCTSRTCTLLSGLGFRALGFWFRVLEFRILGFGFRVSGFGLMVQGFGCKVQAFGFGVQGTGFRVQGSGFRVQGKGFRVDRPPPSNNPRPGSTCSPAPSRSAPA